MAFEWIERVEDLSPAALTVRAQMVDPNDNGRLLWDGFFPRQDVDSVDLNDVLSLDKRPAADRREWNGRGRLIPLNTPDTRKLSMVPIEAYFKIEEREMQRLQEQTLNTAEVIERIIGNRIPARSIGLAETCYRRLELDCMQAWAQGTITQRNPQDASKTYTASYGIPSGRIQTASTAWGDVGLNAYNELMAWYADGVSNAGVGIGVALRQATLSAILADAPNLSGGVKMTLSQIEDRIQQDTGGPFQFFRIENTVDVFDDGGITTTRQKIWPVGRVGFVPSGEAVGYTGFAPIARAMDIDRQVPDARIDIRSVAVFHETSNGARELTVEAQLNALPVPDPGRVWVINAGV